MFPLIQITETVFLPTYLLVISATYSLLIIWLHKRSLKYNFNVNHSLNLALTIMIAGLVGARLFHILYEQPNLYFNDPIQILKIWQGGFVYYGGAIGALIGCLIYIRIKKLNFYQWADFFTPLFPIGYAFGRIGCFLNGCCYGSQCDLPWAVNFKTVDPHTLITRHPTQLYAFLLEILIFLGLLFIEKKLRTKKITLPTGSLFLLWVTAHSINRLIMEFFRDDFRGDTLFNLSISSCVSIALLISSFFLLNKLHKGAK